MDLLALSVLALFFGGCVTAVVLAYRQSLTDKDARRVAEVEAAKLRGDLNVSDANTQAWKRAYERQRAATKAASEVVDAMRKDLVLGAGDHGLDQLRAALDFGAGLLPEPLASGADRAAAVPPRDGTARASTDLLPFPE